MMNLVKLACTCLAFLGLLTCGCSHPISISDDAFGVSGGIVPEPTKSQRANSAFVMSAEDGVPAIEKVRPIEGTGEAALEKSNLPSNFRPLIP